MSKKLDLHGIRHYDVDRFVENFILMNELPLTIVTGNSHFMRDSVMKKCEEFEFQCEQWDSGTIKVLDYTIKK